MYIYINIVTGNTAMDLVPISSFTIYNFKKVDANQIRSMVHLTSHSL